MQKISKLSRSWPTSRIKYNRCKKRKTGRRKKWRESRKSRKKESWNSNRRKKMMTTIKWQISVQSLMQSQLQVKKLSKRLINFGPNKSNNKNGTNSQQARSQASQTSTKRSLKTLQIKCWETTRTWARFTRTCRSGNSCKRRRQRWWASRLQDRWSLRLSKKNKR